MFGNHGTPNAGALLLIHGMYIYAIGVASFGIYCLVKGIKEWFK